jgi:hypothetical protein
VDAVPASVGPANAWRRGSIHSSKGPPSIAVMAPVGIRSAWVAATVWVTPSASHSSVAPITGAQPIT